MMRLKEVRGEKWLSETYYKYVLMFVVKKDLKNGFDEDNNFWYR